MANVQAWADENRDVWKVSGGRCSIMQPCRVCRCCDEARLCGRLSPQALIPDILESQDARYRRHLEQLMARQDCRRAEDVRVIYVPWAQPGLARTAGPQYPPQAEPPLRPQYRAPAPAAMIPGTPRASEGGDEGDGCARGKLD
jgi:hypothetical protein